MSVVLALIALTLSLIAWLNSRKAMHMVREEVKGREEALEALQPPAPPRNALREAYTKAIEEPVPPLLIDVVPKPRKPKRKPKPTTFEIMDDSTAKNPKRNAPKRK